jgi:imidazolonepropionase
MPGFVDCHTHAIFAGSRIEDYEQRLRGKSDAEISRAGGGITLTAGLVRRARQEELLYRTRQFLFGMAAHGTTTVEVKSGYGLEPKQELKILRVLRRLRRGSPVEIVPTLLAAHVLPRDFEDRSREYVDLIKQRLIPTVARQKLAEFVDCFCDRGAFGIKPCRELLTLGSRLGLTPRIHAEQWARTGASRMAVDLGAASADHLDCVTAQDIRLLAQSNTVAVLLPGANFNLGLKDYPPARKLIDAGAAVALATDFNPGTSPTLNMQMILSLACTQMRMTPAETISAATINAAWALRRANRLGSLEPGKHADLLVMDVADYREIPYYFAVNHCLMTVKRGRVVSRRAW